MLVMLCIVLLAFTSLAKASIDQLEIINKRLHIEHDNLLLELETIFPAIKCEEYMEGALKECRDAHVECIQKAYITQEERKTARSIRRSSLDPMSLDDQLKEDEKNIQPQDMTPLQRKINFAKTNDVPLIPFSTLKKMSIKENNVPELLNDGKKKQQITDSQKNRKMDQLSQLKFQSIENSNDNKGTLRRMKRKSVRELKEDQLKNRNK